MSKFVLQQSTVAISHFKVPYYCVCLLCATTESYNNPRQENIFILVFHIGSEWCQNWTLNLLASLPWFPLDVCPWKWDNVKNLAFPSFPGDKLLPLSFSPSHPLKMGLSQSLQLSSLLRLWITSIPPKSILCNESLTWKQQWGGSPKGCLQPRGNRPWWQERSMLLSCREVAGLFCHLLWFHFDHKELGTKMQKKKKKGNEAYFFSAFYRNISIFIKACLPK